MKTALIIGGAAIAVYVVWKFGTASANPPLGTASQPIAPTNAPYPAALPSPGGGGSSAAAAIVLDAKVARALANGVISSSTPVATGLSTSEARQLAAAGYLVLSGNAYARAPRAAATAGTAVVTGGLRATDEVVS